jgi:hypothetical protein
MKSQRKNNLKINNSKMTSQKKNNSKKNYSRKNKRTKKNVKKNSRTKKMRGGGDTILDDTLKQLLKNSEIYKECILKQQKFNRQQVADLCKALSTNTNLESLDISNSKFPPDMIDNFLGSITLNKHLKTLEMNDIDFDRTSDSINDDSLENEEALGDLLTANDTLETLNIRNCNIKNVATIVIKNLNDTLKTLDISDNVIDDKDKKLLENIKSQCKIIM